MSKKLIYISGPSCAGKTSISKLLLKDNPHITYIAGDDSWIKFPKLEFWERVEKSNADILNIITNCNKKLVLLDWVPSRGPFIKSIQQICSDKNMGINHIIVLTSVEILKARKLVRDGNDDVGPTEIEELRKIKSALVLDSSTNSVKDVYNELHNYLLGQCIL
jgi:predicted AAA+ superfamily ATPase